MKSDATLIGPVTPGSSLVAKLAFLGAVLFCLTSYASPGLALAAGLTLAMTLGNPFPVLIKRASKPLLQVSVVLLGFGMNLHVMFAAVRDGFAGLGYDRPDLFVGSGLAASAASGSFDFYARFGRHRSLRRVGHRRHSSLIGAAEAEISVAMGTVFMLNAVALYLFPLLGHAMHLSQAQFGAWAGIAIHDVSSVVGAASAYGQEALQTATVVKLSRTLWIIPVALIAGLAHRRSANVSAKKSGVSVSIPWFIGLFVLASVASTFLVPVHKVAPLLQTIAKTGMTLTLLLIGLSLSRASLKAVGIRPILQGFVLGLVISVASLTALHWMGT